MATFFPENIIVQELDREPPISKRGVPKLFSLLLINN